MAENTNQEPSAPKLKPEVAAVYKVVPGYGSGEICFKGKTVFLDQASLEEVNKLVEAGYPGLEKAKK